MKKSHIVVFLGLSLFAALNTKAAQKAYSGKLAASFSIAEEILYSRYNLSRANWLDAEPEEEKGTRGTLLNYESSLLTLTGLTTPDPSQISIRIEKSAYRLVILRNGKDLKAYPCVFGFNPTDDKRMEGDGCTPEGKFTLRAIYPHDSWSRFMWIDYPTADSYKKHKAAKAAAQIPENASIGGEIGIHGVPDGYDWAVEDLSNWTLGCISLTTEDIIEVYDWCQDGTEVEIVP